VQHERPSPPGPRHSAAPRSGHRDRPAHHVKILSHVRPASPNACPCHSGWRGRRGSPGCCGIGSDHLVTHRWDDWKARPLRYLSSVASRTHGLQLNQDQRPDIQQPGQPAGRSPPSTAPVVAGLPTIVADRPRPAYQTSPRPAGSLSLPAIVHATLLVTTAAAHMVAANRPGIVTDFAPTTCPARVCSTASRMSNSSGEEPLATRRASRRAQVSHAA
jgi:hypothetical protein